MPVDVNLTLQEVGSDVDVPEMGPLAISANPPYYLIYITRVLGDVPVFARVVADDLP